MNLLRAELIKFRSLASVWWLLAISLGLGLAMAALMGSFLNEMPPTTAGSHEIVLGPLFTGLSLLLIWVATIVACTGEYRQGTIRNAFSMRPRRWDVYLGKTVFYVLFTVIASIVVLFATYLLAFAISGNSDLAPWNGDVLGVFGKALVYAAIGTLPMIGASFLLRNGAGTIVLVVAWTQVIEGLVDIIPKVGTDIGKWMPFRNGNEWAASSGFVEALDSPWNLLWFLLIAVIIWGAGLAVVLNRDA